MLFGGAGNDLIQGGTGADTLIGGEGTDTADYSGSLAAVQRVLGGASSGGDAAGDQLSQFENLNGSAFDDILLGDAAVNALNGGMGNDILVGGAGADVVDCGTGLDVASYSNATAGLSVHLTNTAAKTGDARGDAFISIDQLRGSAFAEALTADAERRRGHGAAAMHERIQAQADRQRRQRHLG
jgi:Ca2+-binding RTX toxin-like protein